MNPCEWNEKLTAWLLGELSAEEREAMQRHIAGCGECKAAAEELRETIGLLESALAMPETANIRQPKLDDSRRAMLLDIRPDPPAQEKTNWFLRMHPVFKAAAALIVIFGVVIIAVMPLTFSSVRLARVVPGAKSEGRNRHLSLEEKSVSDMEDAVDSARSERFGYTGADDPFAAADSAESPDSDGDMPADGSVSLSRPARPGATASSGEGGEQDRKTALYSYDDGYTENKPDLLPPAKKPAATTPAPATGGRKDKSVKDSDVWFDTSGVSGNVISGRRVADAVADESVEFQSADGRQAGGDAGIEAKRRFAMPEQAKAQKSFFGRFKGKESISTDSGDVESDLKGVVPKEPLAPEAPAGKPAAEVADHLSSVADAPAEESSGRRQALYYAQENLAKGAEGPAKSEAAASKWSFSVDAGAGIELQPAEEAPPPPNAPAVVAAGKRVPAGETRRSRSDSGLAEEEMEELQIELPKPQFTGTPKDIRGLYNQMMERESLARDESRGGRPDSSELTALGLTDKKAPQSRTVAGQDSVNNQLQGQRVESPLAEGVTDMTLNGALTGESLDGGKAKAAREEESEVILGDKPALGRLFSAKEAEKKIVEASEDTFMTTADMGDMAAGSAKSSLARKALSPEEQKVVDKLSRIVVPEVTFRPPATIKDAVEFFEQASRDYDDPKIPESKRGIKVELDKNLAKAAEKADEQMDDPFAVNEGEDKDHPEGVPQISALSARFISLYDAMKLTCDVTGTKLQIKGDKIEIVPMNDPDEDFVEVKSGNEDLEDLLKDMREKDDGPREEEKKREPIPFNPFVLTADNSFSTFAIDVDTASYTLTRRAIMSGSMPEPESVRTEEIVNAFDYGDGAPSSATFRIYQDGAQSRFGPGLNMLGIGVKGRRLGREEQRPAVLTLLVDTSGSMAQPDRIGLARQAVALLVDQLSPDDRLQVIAYNDHARLVQEPVAASEKETILANFRRLQCNGSTNLEEGMHLAYAQAAASFVPGAENRVILISDGVANLGAGSAQEILDKVESYRKQGITCSVFGVGSGTYNDAMLEGLANKGDGTYRFLDSEEEVKRAFVDDLAATLNTIAKDAKIQVEWNPKVVLRYRQLGYENRALKKEQFRDNTVDAGEVGSGQSVTALYEIELAPSVTPASQLGVVRVRYQRTDNGRIEEIETPLTASTVMRPAHQATASFRVAASAAEFAEQLRGCPHAAGGRFGDIADYLRPAAMELTLDTRVRELLELVMAAEAMR